MKPIGKRFPHIFIAKADTRQTKRNLFIYNDDGDKVEVKIENLYNKKCRTYKLKIQLVRCLH